MTATLVFENDVGRFEMANAMISIMDEWRWNVSAVKHRKQITARGVVIRTGNPATESVLDALATLANRPDGSGPRPELGGPGVLTLPFTTLNHMMIESIEFPVGGWQVAEPIMATFVDDDPDLNEYTVDFFGVDLHNPTFTVPLPYRETRDEYVQQPIDPGSYIDSEDVAFKPIRTLRTHDNIRPVLSGTFRPNYPLDMKRLVERLSQRLGTTHVPAGTSDLPPGYPRVFNVEDFSPMLATRLPLRHLFVVEPQLRWDLAKNVMEVSIVMECPPQKLS